MMDPEYWVYYDTPNGRPKRSFGRDSRAAMNWAKEQPKDRQAEVVKVQSVWSANEDLD
jgi:hypothetical protein